MRNLFGYMELFFNARIIGIFFLLAFLAYGFGRPLFESINNSEKCLGVLLIIANSIMVLFIGILLRKTLKLYNPTVEYLSLKNI